MRDNERVSAVTRKVEKSYRLSSCPGAGKQDFPMNEGEPGAKSNLGMGSGLTDGVHSCSSKERLAW